MLRSFVFAVFASVAISKSVTKPIVEITSGDKISNESVGLKESESAASLEKAVQEKFGKELQKPDNISSFSVITPLNLTNSEINEPTSIPDLKLTESDLKLKLPTNLTGSSENISVAENSTEIDKPVTEVTITSKQLLVTDKIGPNVSEVTTKLPGLNESVTVAVNKNEKDELEKLEMNYKSKVRPSYQPYIDEILRSEPLDDETSSVPSRIKQSQNALDHPYETLPTFSSKELGKLRLNHWRVKQLLKGHDDFQAEKQGLPGTRKEILRGKYPHPLLGQKRASREPSYLDDSAVDALSSLLSSADDESIQEQLTSQKTSNLRTFFGWFTNPLKKEEIVDVDKNEYFNRAQLLKAQQAILPLALDYRGDFLIW